MISCHKVFQPIFNEIKRLNAQKGSAEQTKRALDAQVAAIEANLTKALQQNNRASVASLKEQAKVTFIDINYYCHEYKVFSFIGPL